MDKNARKFFNEVKHSLKEMVSSKVHKQMRELDAHYAIILKHQSEHELDQIYIPDIDSYGFRYSIDKKNGFIAFHSP
jgi:hypothetical protein